MSERRSFTSDEARSVGERIGIDWAAAPFDVEQFRMGMDVELEHGLHDLLTNVTDSDPIVTGKIALAHLNEFPDYYTRPRQDGRRGQAGSRRQQLTLTRGSYGRCGRLEVCGVYRACGLIWRNQPCGNSLRCWQLWRLLWQS
jgi:hypothetical protein